MVNPWIPKNDSEKRVVEETYRRIIDTYLQNDKIKTIIFNWVIKADWMFDLVTQDLDENEVIIKKIVLVCDKYNHVERLKEDCRRDELVENPEDMERYKNLDAYIVDVTNDPIEKNTLKVMRIIEG